MMRRSVLVAMFVLANWVALSYPASATQDEAHGTGGCADRALTTWCSGDADLFGELYSLTGGDGGGIDQARFHSGNRHLEGGPIFGVQSSR